MKVSQIRYFIALSRELNFTRAARSCQVSQPSLSNGIRALESELGGPVFDRSTMALTRLGNECCRIWKMSFQALRGLTRRQQPSEGMR